MLALSWCLTNLFPPSNNNILFMLYVKPPVVYSSIGATVTLIIISCAYTKVFSTENLFNFDACYASKVDYLPQHNILSSKPCIPATNRFLFSADVEAMEKYGKNLAMSVMPRAQSVCSKFNHNIKVEKKVGRGDAKEVICAAVGKLEADILVIGSHKYGFFKRTLLGSVSDYCSKHVKCAMVVVKKPKNEKNINV